MKIVFPFKKVITSAQACPRPASRVPRPASTSLTVTHTMAPWSDGSGQPRCSYTPCRPRNDQGPRHLTACLRALLLPRGARGQDQAPEQ